MMGWLTIIKTIGSYIGGWGVSVSIAWLGFSQLYRWYTTGELLTYSGGRGTGGLPITWYLITYESHPFDFVSFFATYVIIAAFGLAACVGRYLIIRKGWRNEPKPTPE
jgi:hypothetical protein